MDLHHVRYVIKVHIVQMPHHKFNVQKVNLIILLDKLWKHHVKIAQMVILHYQVEQSHAWYVPREHIAALHLCKSFVQQENLELWLGLHLKHLGVQIIALLVDTDFMEQGNVLLAHLESMERMGFVMHVAPVKSMFLWITFKLRACKKAPEVPSP